MKEFFKNKKIIKGVLITILILILLVGSYVIYNSIKLKNIKNQASDFIKDNQEILDNEVFYSIVSINPKIVFEIKGELVIDYSCLNNDCESVIKNLKFENKNLTDVIDDFYNETKNLGFDISKGVTISSSNSNIKSIIKLKDYMSFEIISNSDEQEILKDAINNDDIKNQTSKNDYLNKLLDTYKKDTYYNDLYSCNIVSDNLECYITEKFNNELPSQISFENWRYYNEDHHKLMNVFDKFNIEYEVTTSGVEGLSGFSLTQIDKIKMNDKWYNLGGNYLDSSSTGISNNNIVIKMTPTTSEYENIGDFETIPLNKIDLIDLSYNNNDIEIYRNYVSNTITGPGEPEKE